MSEEKTSMLAVCVDEAGKLDVKRVPRPEPKDGQLLIEVAATALNRADLLQKRGLYPPPPGESEILGLEVSGVIADIGPGVKGNWMLGNKVMALLGGGGYAEYVAVPEELIMPVPSHLNLHQAAALPEAWLTAYQLLHFIGLESVNSTAVLYGGVRELSDFIKNICICVLKMNEGLTSLERHEAKVKPNETVLIHAGASGVGTAAIQLVRLCHAIPVVTTGSPEKLTFAEQIGAALGVNYKEEDFSEKVLQFTEGKGADVILDCIGGSFWEKNICSLAMDGRWVLYGTLGGKTADGDLFGKLLRKRGHLLCSLLRNRSLQYKAELVRSFTEQVLPHFQSTDPPLRPVIDSMFNMEDVQMAHQHMEANKNIGKIIIKIGTS